MKSSAEAFWIPLASRKTFQFKNNFDTNVDVCSRRGVVPPAQVTTAIIFNVAVFNEALKRVLTAQKAAGRAATTPEPENIPKDRKIIFPNTIHIDCLGHCA